MNILEQFKRVTGFVFGIDGVLTDGRLLVMDNGEPLRQLNIRDGYALQLAVKKGYRIILLSGGNPVGIGIRLKQWGIIHLIPEVENKAEKLDELVMQLELDWEKLLVMGHDLPDFASLKKAGMSCAPSDAAAEIKQISKYVSPFQGGAGCVRDVIEKVLKLNGHWEFESSLNSG